MHANEATLAKSENRINGGISAMNATRAPGGPHAQPSTPMPSADAARVTRTPSGTPPDAAVDASYVLTLYVASLSPRSVMAIRSVKAICERHLSGQYSLEIVDICDHPSLAKHDQIVAVPTLIKRLPLPLHRIIGDMADEHRVLIGLDLSRRGDRQPSQT
ncbi:MAG: circadian clock KaiB family protein [Halochromatium sp.]